MCDVKVILRHTVIVIIGIFIKLIAVTETSHGLCSENNTCSEGWEYSRCSCYFFVHEPVNHTAAVRECQQMGAHLVFIHDQQENDFIRDGQTDEQTYTLTSGRTSYETWIGLTTDIVGDKRRCEKNTSCNRENWTLLDDTEASFTNWRNGEPSGDSSCIRMLSSGHWGDIACTTSKHYVCEMSPSYLPIPDVTTPTAKLTTVLSRFTPNDAPETMTGALVPDACLAGWEYRHCSCYLFPNESLNHAAAASSCQKMEAHLVFIDNESENNFIENRTSEETWIGLTTDSVGNERGCDANTSCNRESWFLQHRTKANFSNWNTQEPSGDSACVRMLPSGQWADIACLDSKHYACEMSPISATEVCIIPNDVTETTVRSLTPVNQPTESGITLLEISIIAGVVVCCLIAVVIIIVLVMKKRSSHTSKSSYQMESGNETNSRENMAVLYKADDHPSNAESRDETRDLVYINNHAMLEIPKTYHTSTDVVYAVSVTGGQNGSVIWDEMINNELYGSTGVNA